MYTKVLQGTRYYEVEQKMRLTLHYYVTERRISSNESYYGIEIEQIKTNGSIGNTIESDRLLLSEDKEWVEGIVNKMIGYGVTPITMGSIIDDMMTGLAC